MTYGNEGKENNLMKQEAELPRCDYKTRLFLLTLPDIKAKKDIKRLQCMHCGRPDKNISIHLRYLKDFG